MSYVLEFARSLSTALASPVTFLSDLETVIDGALMNAALSQAPADDPRVLRLEAIHGAVTDLQQLEQYHPTTDNAGRDGGEGERRDAMSSWSMGNATYAGLGEISNHFGPGSEFLDTMSTISAPRFLSMLNHGMAGGGGGGGGDGSGRGLVTEDVAAAVYTLFISCHAATKAKQEVDALREKVEKHTKAKRPEKVALYSEQLNTATQRAAETREKAQSTVNELLPDVYLTFKACFLVACQDMVSALEQGRPETKGQNLLTVYPVESRDSVTDSRADMNGASGAGGGGPSLSTSTYRYTSLTRAPMGSEAASSHVSRQRRVSEAAGAAAPSDADTDVVLSALRRRTNRTAGVGSVASASADGVSQSRPRAIAPSAASQRTATPPHATQIRRQRTGTDAHGRTVSIVELADVRGDPSVLLEDLHPTSSHDSGAERSRGLPATVPSDGDSAYHHGPGDTPPAQRQLTAAALAQLEAGEPHDGTSPESDGAAPTETTEGHGVLSALSRKRQQHVKQDDMWFRFYYFDRLKNSTERVPLSYELTLEHFLRVARRTGLELPDDVKDDIVRTKKRMQCPDFARTRRELDEVLRNIFKYRKNLELLRWKLKQVKEAEAKVLKYGGTVEEPEALTSTEVVGDANAGSPSSESAVCFSAIESSSSFPPSSTRRFQGHQSKKLRKWNEELALRRSKVAEMKDEVFVAGAEEMFVFYEEMLTAIHNCMDALLDMLREDGSPSGCYASPVAAHRRRPSFGEAVEQAAKSRDARVE